MKITDKNWKKTHEDLTRPFGDDDVYWRVERAFGRKAMVLCYLDARALQNRLDDVLGAESWTCTYRETSSGKNICTLSIKINGEWIPKEDGAGDTQFEAAKGGISGALKRAGVAWGIGRHLYDLGNTWVDLQEEKLRVEDRYKITHKDKETRKYLFAKAPSVEFLQSHLFPDGPKYARIGPKVVDKEEEKKEEKKEEPKKEAPKKKSTPKKKAAPRQPGGHPAGHAAVADEISKFISRDDPPKKRAQQRIKLVFQKGNIPRENLHKTMRAAMAKWEDGKPTGFGFQSPLEAEEDLFVQASINILNWFGFGELEQRVDQYIEWHYQNNGDYDENMAPF